MKERPILFSAPMVRAILDGRKTQTRRAVKPQPDVAGKDFAAQFTAKDEELGRLGKIIPCPYGVPGDRLWVRETWAWLDWCHQGSYSYVPPELPTYPPHFVAADGGRRTVKFKADYSEKTAWGMTGEPKWQPSIHMPRCASRITLEITGVRVERLQDISAKDILAEGAVARAHDSQFGHNPVSAFDGKCYLDLVSLWAHGWQSIHGPGSWEANPWVWVIEFKRIAKEAK